jgi:pantoate--beta-alanine ligase
MRIYADPAELQAESLSRRARGQRVGLVPTMGALHRGHLSLMERLRPLCDWLVVSIYVNPLQFGPTEDLSRYPRDPEGDAALCASAGVDAILMPPTLYPPGHRTRVTVSGLTEGLCGASRPGHFEGVTTVVARLFGLVLPHVAIFGEKDYQQLAVLRRMTADLALPIEVLGGALVRDHDGLALSSRNVYLGPWPNSRPRSPPASATAPPSSPPLSPASRSIAWTTWRSARPRICSSWLSWTAPPAPCWPPMWAAPACWTTSPCR